jgi:hypothetical protein
MSLVLAWARLAEVWGALWVEELEAWPELAGFETVFRSHWPRSEKNNIRAKKGLKELVYFILFYYFIDLFLLLCWDTLWRLQKFL